MSLEKRGGRGCMLRVNDDHHAEHRAADIGRNRRVSGREPKYRILGGGRAILWLHRASFEGQGYRRLDRRCKGGRLFLIKVTGLSRAQDEHRCCSARSLHCWSKGRGLCAGRAGSVGDVTAIGREPALALIELGLEVGPGAGNRWRTKTFVNHGCAPSPGFARIAGPLGNISPISSCRITREQHYI